MSDLLQLPEFHAFKKIPRLSRECIITEKIDGTNGVIYISEELDIIAGSHHKWITSEKDNYGFAKWVQENADELVSVLGAGYHYGEWWGKGIQRGYNLETKKFSLFNVGQWNNENKPQCCEVVPIIRIGLFKDDTISDALEILRQNGSKAAPGYVNPEGIVIYHSASKQYFKKTLENDEKRKSDL